MSKLTKLFDSKMLKVLNHPILVCSIYIVTYFVYRDLGIRMMLGYGALAILVFGTVLKYFILKEKVWLTNIHIAYLVHVVVLLLSFVRPVSNHDNENLVYCIVMTLTAILIVFSKSSIGDVKRVMKVFSISATAFATFVLFFQLFKKLYWQLVYPLLSITAKEYADRFFFKGYSVSIGGVAFTDYVLVIGFACLMSYLLFHSIKKRYKHIIIALLCLIFFTILIAGRRGELLALVISLGVFYVASAEFGKRYKRFFIFVGVFVSLVAIFIIFLPVLNKFPFLHRYTMTISNILYNGGLNSGIDSGRFNLYSIAWILFLEKPFFGFGFGKFGDIAAYTYGINTTIKDVHNIVLQLLAENGMIGAILVLGSILYIYKLTYSQTGRLNKLRKTQTVNPWLLSANAVALIFQTFFLAVSLLDPINYKVIFWPIYFVVVLLLIMAYEIERPESFDFLSIQKKVLTLKEKRNG